MNKVLVTGANGFVGKHVVAVLQQTSFEVHAVGRSPVDPAVGGTVSRFEGVKWHRADLFDESQTEALMERVRPTHLLHLAWEATPGYYWHAPSNYRWVEASVRLLRHFHANGGRRVVAAGTCAEYDWRYGVLFENETPLAHDSTYAVCKNAFRSLLHRFAADHDGFSCAWGRLFFLYGPYEHSSRFVPYVIRSLLQNKEALCSAGQHLRDYIYVRDAADALATLLASEWNGDANIASGETIRMRDMALRIAYRLGKPELVRFGGSRQEPFPLVQGDISALSALGWSPRTGLNEGIGRTVAWWEETMKGGTS
ncbi:NAD(P)-dependent oxidoreductase [Paenibacillus sp. CECT 9249]|uniref:NAD-dependent epimerase/dehydratase family protein n=1 Tax=unclassified Paenibacillus TaxID=185978 RepID=UPI001C125FE5|nr:NAD-dependent epimerase/dehydratase family protein [Paenibacillus sp. CECT 9249]MBU5440799.1 NAD-dependent epimerase/dehydratase family protein [Paenibacillus sp. MSJ-34]CAH0118505.1 GDP-L-fucose synthase [Paenibacillus sp. CECT 9249]